MLTAKNYEPLIADVLHLIKAGEEVGTSTLQRELGIGYARAGRMMDEMVCLKFVSPPKGYKGLCLVDGHNMEVVKHLVEVAGSQQKRD